MEIQDVYQSVLEGRQALVAQGVRALLEQGVIPGSILNQALVPAMDEVGCRFEQQEFFVPEMLAAARAMQAGMNVLRPLLVEEELQPIGRIAIGTVKGDMHDIGKNLVSMMLESAGFQVVDLGVDTPTERFVEAASSGSQIVGMSALITTTMPAMKEVIAALTSANLRGNVKVIIGGAPTTQAYADDIGADAYAPDAGGAVRVAKGLLGLADAP
jgi:5-methyltetrahydrofolate--homocysteine methyltransferase